MLQYTCVICLFILTEVVDLVISQMVVQIHVVKRFWYIFENVNNQPLKTWGCWNCPEIFQWDCYHKLFSVSGLKKVGHEYLYAKKYRCKESTQTGITFHKLHVNIIYIIIVQFTNICSGLGFLLAAILLHVHAPILAFLVAFHSVKSRHSRQVVS